MPSDNFNTMLNDAIQRSGLSDGAIAEKAGFKASNVVKLIRQDVLKLPHEKLFPLIRVLDVDEPIFISRYVSEYANGEFTIRVDPDNPEEPEVAFALRMVLYLAALKGGNLSPEIKSALGGVLDLVRTAVRAQR
ncbi:hypothetical protein [Arenibacterium halophilum]|uniref:HTH cro/C1-type domain-containing protein n=1 Tax=Arenibacterium halophilum TaxID=2583821 RepID=A0ABY2WY37_9RHOB|nr:hypothetical protein [Arenibacterium halophilum]TMV07434.1 hypothetical protein FGK64_21435 [Arenibacterium halophilum]